MQYNSPVNYLKDAANNPAQQTRRKIAREVGEMWNDIALACGYTPIELRAAWAIEIRLDEMGRGPDSPRWVSNAAIGRGLVSNTKDIEHAKRTARNRVGHLFNKAIPRTGFQIMTRYKVGDDEQHPNEFVSHLMPVAAFFSELLTEELKAINKLDSTLRGAAKAEARERIIADALTYLPKCEAVILEPDGETVYAYVSAAEAKAYCEKKPEYKSQAYQYQEPEPKAKAPKPFYSDDFDRLKKRAVEQAVDTILNAIGERNGKDTARAFWVKELLPALEHAGERWVNYCRVADEGEREEGEIELPTEENPVLPPASEPQDSGADLAGGGEEKLSPLTPDNSAEDNNLQPQFFDSVAPVELECSINFDTSLEAALDYVRDGWAVVPCCQFDPATGRCTGPDSHHKDEVCKGKVPLIKGKKPVPGSGYTAASRDRGLILDWFTRQFPDAGVALRLDNCILLDCDVKNGGRGLESYAELDATFNLPATLTAITPSGGRHYIFKLPEGLPADYLGSWTRVLDSVGLNDIDTKVHVKGLAHVEPTRGVAGVYRWIDPTADIAELPREVCDFIHDVHEAEQQAKLDKSANLQTPTRAEADDVTPFDPNEDQSKFVKDMPAGKRRPRLRSIAVKLARGGANKEQIVKVLKYHDSQFKEAGPTNDALFMARVAQGAVMKFGQEVAR